MNSARKRIVFDTSVLVAVCLYPDREPAQVFRLAILACDVFVSPDTWRELLGVLSREKFNAWQPLETRMAWAKLFQASAIFVSPTTRVDACKDPKDNPFLALAVAAHADVLLSSDNHLLELHPFRGIDILSLAQWKRLTAVTGATG